MTQVRIKTACRLHFGLLGWGRDAPRQFGGVGLMIEDPGLELLAERAREPIAEGPLAPRIRHLLAALPDRLAGLGVAAPAGSVRIRVVTAPDEHLGLGVGTQISLAVTRAFLELNEVDPSRWGPCFLAKLSERGARSGIGLHGFFQGGFLIDGGHRVEGDVPPLLARHRFPDEWHILMIQPPLVGLHGAGERRAFAELPPVPERVTERLCRLVLLDLLPGLVERDLDGFGQALGELQRRVGECFSPVQGGLFASVPAAEIVDELGRLGLKGAGQSSWGPTLYAFTEADPGERTVIARRIRDRFGLANASVSWTCAANHGAVVELTSSPDR
jgi:beta-RFAP synthase